MGLTRRWSGLTAATFDLDDTLYPQVAYLAGAWDAVVAVAPGGVDPAVFRAALVDVAAEGSDRGRIIDRALARIGADGADVGPLVRAFRDHRPDRLEPYPGVVAALARLRRRIPVGLVTDGDVGIQEAKLRALGLVDAFDVVICSDRFGRAQRKPSPVPFGAALRALGARPGRSVHVGDRPDKDVAGARGAGMAAVRVRTGEYASAPDPGSPADGRWASVPDVVAAVVLVEEALAHGRAGADGPGAPGRPAPETGQESHFD